MEGNDGFPYSYNGAIVCRDVRYVMNDFGQYMLYHSIVNESHTYEPTGEFRNPKEDEFFLSDDGRVHLAINDFVNKKYKIMRRKTVRRTLNCTAMDSHGFCRGHEITKRAFVAMYCDGAIPPEVSITEKERVARALLKICREKGRGLVYG